MIFNHYKVINFHPGKTAGTSLEEAFLPYFRERLQHGDINYMFGGHARYGVLVHATINTFQFIHNNKYNHYYKIATIRNPYTKMRSVYYYQKNRFKKQNINNFKDFCNKLNTLLLNTNEFKSKHWLPQHLYTHKFKQLFVDKIIPFESFNQNFKSIEKQFNIKVKSVNHNYNKQYLNNFHKDYDDECINIIKNLYIDDFNIYNYSTDINQCFNPPVL